MKRAHQVRPATLDELAIIVEELPDRYQLMALLAAWCAMRFGELAELRRGDIDLRTTGSTSAARWSWSAASSSSARPNPTPVCATSPSRRT
ncbi:MAG: hypothetical protein R2734_19745 [Nocardioides sp.]